jgi:hypothetical protein
MISADVSGGKKYAKQVRRLERMQRLHRLYLYRGVAVSSMLIFSASIFAIELDKNGWGRTANAIFPATLIICLVAPVVFLANLVILYRWRCPRCRAETIGWVAKEADCFKCGLAFRRHSETAPPRVTQE